jgi:hypothetical protein
MIPTLTAQTVPVFAAIQVVVQRVADEALRWAYAASMLDPGPVAAVVVAAALVCIASRLGREGRGGARRLLTSSAARTPASSSAA